jgi:cytochrome c-type biogenesis protein
MENVTLGLAVIAGFLSFISPCVLPLVPAYIGYMSGRMTHNIARQTAAGTTQSTSLAMRLHLLFHGLAFVAGFTFIFVMVGLLTTALVSVAGQYVNTFTLIIGRVGGIVIIFFGLQFMGVMPKFFRWIRKKENSNLLDNILISIGLAIGTSGLIYWGFVEQLIIALPLIAGFILAMFINDAFTKPAVFWNNILNRLELLLYSDTRGDMEPNGREGLVGSAIMGMVFSAGWTPCIGPLLGTILTVAATTGDIAQGMLMLTAYSLGLGVPFIITALLLNSAQGILRRLQKHMHKIELISGSLLIAIGILVASGQLQSLSQTFSQGDFADFTFRVEECGIGFFEGELNMGHVGSCLGGSLVPVAINQSASGNFTAEQSEQQYLFHADAGEIVDFEVRSVNEAVIDFNMTLFSPDDTELANSSKADSITADSKYYPLANFTLEEEGLYRIVISNTSQVEKARFRVKVREAQPIDSSVGAGSSLVDVVASGTVGGQTVTQVDGSPQTDALDSLANSALNSIIGVADSIDPAVGIKEGNRAPDFTVMTVDDNPITLSDLRGNVVLLNFWGTWCGPCRREMPEFQRAYEKFNNAGFEILAVAADDSFEAIATFRDEFELTFPLALDETSEINDAYGIMVRPSSFLLDKNGMILARHFGMMTETQIQEMLEEALAE